MAAAPESDANASLETNARRQSEGRQACRDLTDDVDATALKIEQIRSHDCQYHDSECRRNLGRVAMHQKERCQADQAHDKGSPVNLPEIDNEGQYLRHKIRAIGVEAQQLVQLTDEDGDGNANHKTIQHRDAKGNRPAHPAAAGRR